MFILKTLSKLPLTLLYPLSSLIYFVAYHIVGYRKEVVRENLKNSFPEKSDKERRIIEKTFYKRFSDFVIEVMKALSMRENALRKRVKFINDEVFEDIKKEGKSIILLASHQFNWEWALLTGCLKLPYPVDAVYQKLSNKKFDRLMLDLRSRFGGNPIERDNALLGIMRGVKNLRAIAINADQVPHRGNKEKYWTRLLHQDTAFYTGIGQIPKMTKMPAFFLRIKCPKRGYYTVEFVPIGTPPYDKDSHIVIERYAREMERAICEEPEGWLWSHKRWKYKKPLYA